MTEKLNLFKVHNFIDSSMRGNGGPKGDDGEQSRWPKEVREGGKRGDGLFVLLGLVNT